LFDFPARKIAAPSFCIAQFFSESYFQEARKASTKAVKDRTQIKFGATLVSGFPSPSHLTAWLEVPLQSIQHFTAS